MYKYIVVLKLESLICASFIAILTKIVIPVSNNRIEIVNEVRILILSTSGSSNGNSI